MTTIYLTNGTDELRTVTLEELAAARADDSVVYWIDMTDPTEQEEDDVLDRAMGFHPLAIGDCRRERVDPTRGDHLPKVEDYGDYLFSVVNPIRFTPTNQESMDEVPTVVTRQLNVFLGENFIVTHHYEPSRAIEQVAGSCRKNPVHLERGPDYVYHLILDSIVDDLTPLLDSYDEWIEELEDAIFGRMETATLNKLLAMKRQVFRLRRTITYQREMVYRLSRGEFALITQEEIAYYRNVFDHLVRAAELTESYRDILTGLLDAYLSMTSNRLNEVMKVLAIISTFFLPLTFIAGVYGMNFDPDTSPWNMPELRWFFGYPMAWGIMLAVSVVMFVYFKRRKWL